MQLRQRFRRFYESLKTWLMSWKHIMQLGQSFKELTGYAPFAWQTCLFEDHLLDGRFPSTLDLPTGLGKILVMTVWYLAWRADAPVPRRLVYVVDQATAVGVEPLYKRLAPMDSDFGAQPGVTQHIMRLSEALSPPPH